MTEKDKKRLIERFNAMVSPTPTARGCRAWLGYKRENGYGGFEICAGGEASAELAHRVAYAIGTDDFSILRLYGSQRDRRGPVVRHVRPDGSPCDFKHCVEFSHLVMGTQQENINDNVQHGKILIGEQVGTAKLTEDQARSIGEEYTAARAENGGKVPYGFATSLAKKYGVCREVPRLIAAGRLWKHLKH